MLSAKHTLRREEKSPLEMSRCILTAVLAAMLLVSCTEPRYKCNIYGTVNDPELEGVCVFLVPFMEKVIEPTKENLDSTFIKDGKFEFHTNVERMGDIRLSKWHRRGFQNLLVITEPGDIHVVIDRESYGSGTPQNDSLQVWKDFNKMCRERMVEAAGKEDFLTKETISREFVNRSLRMARACGDSSTFAKFIFRMYGEEPR